MWRWKGRREKGKEEKKRSIIAMRIARRKGNWFSRVSFSLSTDLFTVDSSFNITSEKETWETKRTAEAEGRIWKDVKRSFKTQKKSRPNTSPT